jgi:hypothetical protein
MADCEGVTADGTRSAWVNTIVKLGKGTIQIPGERQAMILILFEPLEFFDEVELELRTEPRTKL